MKQPRFFIVWPEHLKNAPVRFNGQRYGAFCPERKECAIHDRENLKPNPNAPGYKRYKMVAGPMSYFDAITKVKELNAAEFKPAPKFWAVAGRTSASGRRV